MRAAYARDVVMADFEMPGDDDIFTKVKADLAAKSVNVSERVLERQLQECRALAVQQIKVGVVTAAEPRPAERRPPSPGVAAGRSPRRRRPSSRRCPRSTARPGRSRPATAIGRRTAGAPTSEPPDPLIRNLPTSMAQASGRAGEPAAAAPAPELAELSRSGLVLLLALTITWGLNWPMMKLALQEVQPWAFRSLCLIIGGASLLALTRASGGTVRIPAGRLAPLALVALFNITSWHLLSAYALLYTGSGRAAIIGYTMPLWASLTRVAVLGARLTLQQGLALLLGMAALVLLIGQDIGVVGAAPTGALLMAGAALSWAIGTVLVKRFAWDGMPVMAMTGWQQLIGGAPIVLGWWLLEPWPDLLGLSLPAAFGLAYAVLVATIFCQTAYFKLVSLLAGARRGASACWRCRWSAWSAPPGCWASRSGSPKGPPWSRWSAACSC